MKRLVLLLALLLAAPAATGQTVGASQIRKKASGGLGADSANALAVTVPRGTTAPASPLTGQTWCDTNYDPCLLKIYTGSTWTAAPAVSGLTQADLSAFPVTPSDGQIVWIRSLRRAVVYDATAATWYYLDGQNRQASATYELDAVGYSAPALSAPAATTGSVTAGGAVTVGAHYCLTSVYNSTGGETTPGASTGALTATSGQQTLSLTIPTGGTGTRGRRVWCTKANTTAPYFLVATVDDNTTTATTVTVADASYELAAAPDKNFSGDLPSGWTFYAPGIAHGGCGSTGTSILCASYVGVSNSATSSGIRLFWGYPTGTDNWQAEWRITSIRHGFPGSGTVFASATPIAVVSSSSVDVAPNMHGLSTYWSPADIQPGVAAFGPRIATRAAGAAWSTATGNSYAWPLLDDYPLYIRARGARSGANYGTFLMVSRDGDNWWSADFSTDYSADMCSITKCFATETRFIGLAIERCATGTTQTGGVYEFDGFTWKSL